MPRTARRREQRWNRRLLAVVTIAMGALAPHLLPSAGADQGEAPPEVGQPPSLVTGGATWDPIFVDDFSGTAVDESRWNVADVSNYGTGGHQDQCYRAADTTVADGTLRLTGNRETVTDCGTNPDGGSSYYFTSGLVTTRRQGGPLKFKYRQGYTEIRMRVPRGNLYWPAFWLVGAGDGSSPGWPAYGEFDVSEIYGSKPDISESNFHRTGGSIGARNHNVAALGSSSTLNVNPPNEFVAGGTNDWHTYGLNWTADGLQWFIDGTLVRSYAAVTADDVAALGYEHSIILNLAMGGDGPRYDGYTGNETADGYDDGNLVADLPGAMEVDYVKVWQAPPPPPTPPTVTLTAPADGSVVTTPTTAFTGTCTTAAGTVTVELTGDEPASLATSCVDGIWSTSAVVPDGAYSVTASQTADVTGTTAPVAFTVDTVITAPQPVTLDAPVAGAVLASGPLAYSGRCDPDVGPVDVSISGSVSLALTAACIDGAWSSSGTLGDGLYSATASQTDATGGTAVSAASGFRVDGLTPVTTDDSASIGSAWRTTGATVTLTPADSGSGVAQTYYTTDGSTPDLTSPTGTSIALTAEGVYTIRYLSVDQVGNPEPVQTASTPIRIDWSAPVTTDDTESIGSAWTKQDRTVTLTPAEAVSGAATTYSTIDGSTPTTASTAGTSVPLSTSGTFTVRYFSVDAAGNAEAVRTAGTQIRIDQSVPTTSMTFPVDGLSYNAASWTAGCSPTARICGTAGDAHSGVASVRVSVQRSTDGRYWNGGSWQTASTSVTATGTGTWSVPLATSQLTNRGVYTVTAWSLDAVGNRSANAVRTFTYDTSGPTTTAASIVSTNRNGAVNPLFDTMAVTFNEALSPASLPTTATLTLSRSSRNTSYGITGLTNGLRTTGATGYLTSSSSTRTVTFVGTLALSNGDRTVTFVVTGACSGACTALSTTARSGAFEFVAATALRDIAGNAPSSSTITASSQVMF